MNKLGRLIKNEILKKIKQPSTIILSALFIIVSFAVPFLMYNPNNYDWGKSYDRIAQEIEMLNSQNKYIDDSAPDYAREQYTVAIEFLEDARKFNLQPDDWRYEMLFEAYYKFRANYEIKLIIDGTVVPSSNMTDPEKNGAFLENRSGLIYSDLTLSKEQLQVMYDSNKAEIDSVLKAIENNDYKLYCRNSIEGYKQTVESIKKDIETQKAEVEKKPFDLNLKTQLKQSEMMLEGTELQIKVAQYRLDNDVAFDGEWKDATLKAILSNSNEINSIKLRLFEYEQKGEPSYNEYEYLGLSLEDMKTASQKQLAALEDQNKISWYSVENGVSHYTNVDDSRTYALQFFSLTMFAAVVALFLASNIVSSEFSTKTINMLIIRPVKRWKIITAKFITVLIFSYAIYTLGMFVFLISIGINYGFGALALPYLYVSGSSVGSMGFILYMLQNMLFCSVNIVFLVTLVFMMSTLTKNTALSAISGMGLYFFSSIVYQILLYVADIPLSVLRYTILPYFNLENFVVQELSYMSTINYLLLPEFGAGLFIVLSAVMFAISLTVFNKRDVK